MKKIKFPILFLAVVAAALLLSLLINMCISLVRGILHPREYGEQIDKYSNEYNIPDYIVYAIIDVESSFDPLASSGEAYGLMQMTPSTFRWLSSNEHLGENLYTTSLFDPDVSIRYGCYYLRYLFDKFQNPDTVFAAYNAGEGNVTKWLASREYSDGNGGLKLNKIPFEETRKYVKKVNKSIEYYKLHI